MELITLAQFKAHARIDGTDEDAAAQLKVDAANGYVVSFLGTLPVDYVAPDELVQATLMIASHWWEHRETTFAGDLLDIPLDASEIIANHREWAF
ncbi:head-tail connector protein [Sinorhizobium meliloti]|uniref:head-tail connector protein n=1 Tax=Rhizobium meliloti TaxID=382 RepID=UPI001296F8D6|nr:head-tail connector protein [Sinorhizobium meliloti]MQX28872.1 phage gp6-like head-tail connector protein [Sinorhizobium meliloti]